MTAVTAPEAGRQAGVRRMDERAAGQIRLLMVEDDERIRLALRLALADEGCVVVEAPSGEAALSIVDHAAIDVVLLDLMLPGIDGLEVCRTLRSRGDMPIIIVSARSDSSDVVAGLEAGADDYVTKPLVAGELAARIRALLRRRRPGSEGPALRLGPLEIHPEEETVTRDGDRLHLTRTELGCSSSWRRRGAGWCRGRICCGGCGAMTTSAIPACSTCTSGACAGRWNAILMPRNAC